MAINSEPAFTYIFYFNHLYSLNSFHILWCQEHIISFSLISVSQVPITACVVKSASVYARGQAQQMLLQDKMWYIFCMWNRIKPQIHQTFYFKERKLCHLMQTYFFIKQFHSMLLSSKFPGCGIAIHSFSLRETLLHFVLCLLYIIPCYYTKLLLACSSPAVREKEPSWQGSLSWTGHHGVLH